MKKLVMTVAMLAATAAMAGEFVTFGIDGSKEYSGGLKADAGSVVIGTVQGPVTVDGKATLEHAQSGGAVTNDVQVRAAYAFGPVYVRGGLGERLATGGDYSYYTYAVGAKVPVGPVAVVGEAERQNSFSAGHPSFETYKVGVECALTDKDVIGATYNVNSADVVSHGVGLTYTRKF